MKCGFLHIPALPEQILAQWPQHLFTPLDMSRMAVEIVVKDALINSEHPRGTWRKIKIAFCIFRALRIP